MSILEYLSAAQHAAQIAGDVITEYSKKLVVREKAARDLVTDADVAAQHVIKNYLLDKFPNHGFVGEEGDPADNIQSSEYCWLVDPIDGTANYVHGFPNYATSIALVHRGQVVVGVVFDPVANEMFSAVQGLPATLNGREIRASSCTAIGDALIAASFPPNVSRESLAVQHFIEVLLQCQSVRRLGSAALNLCYVACGRMDGYWANCVKSWDIAAGALIAQQSGAHLTGWQGESFSVWQGHLTVAATPSLHAELLGCLSQA
jgi:myo-inositol-1(or 4)-monophosphatase